MKNSRPRVTLAAETGSAMVEFVALGLVLQCSVLLFGTQILQDQKDQLAVSSSARQAARALTLDSAAGVTVEQIQAQQTGNFGLRSGELNISVEPVAPGPGQVVSATATLHGFRSEVRMRVPRT